MEVDAERVIDRAVNAGEERADIEGLRAADVDNEVSVERGDFRPARAPALGPGGLDQAARLVTRRIAEARPGVGHGDGLGGLAADEPILGAGAHRGRIAALERQRDVGHDRVPRQRGLAVREPDPGRRGLGLRRGLHAHVAYELADLAVGTGVHA